MRVALRRWAAVLAVVGSCSLVACGDRGAATDERVIRADSAGLALLSIQGPLEGLPLILPRDTTPLTGVPEDFFANNPQNGMVLGDGRLLFTEGTHIGSFGADGRFLGEFARRGRGPGEVSMLAGWWRGRDGALWISDIATRRLSLFDSTLTYVRSVELPRWSESLGISTWAGLNSDTVAIVGFALNEGSTAPGRHRSEYALGHWAIGSDSALVSERRPFAEYQLYPPGAMPESGGPAPFARGAEWKALGRCMVYGFSDAWEFRLEEPGAAGSFTMLSVLRAPGSAPSQVDAEARERFITRTAAQYPPSLRETVARALREHGQFPATTPHFGRVLTAPDGALWVQRYRGPSTDAEDHWTVVDLAGARAWRVVIPGGSRLLVVDAGRALVATKDADDLETQAWWRFPDLAGITLPDRCRLD